MHSNLRAANLPAHHWPCSFKNAESSLHRCMQVPRISRVISTMGSTLSTCVFKSTTRPNIKFILQFADFQQIKKSIPLQLFQHDRSWLKFVCAGSKLMLISNIGSVRTEHRVGFPTKLPIWTRNSRLSIARTIPIADWESAQNCGQLGYFRVCSRFMCRSIYMLRPCFLFRHTGSAQN